MYRQQQFNDLVAGKRILIAGYGREGRSTHCLLQRLAPASCLTVATNDDEIFKALEQAARCNQPYDLVVKSPGIPTMKLEGRCELDTVTSQCDLFLQVYGDLTVGVTGTKGKSTTATLLGHVLSSSLPDRHVVVAGNMGVPLFDIVDEVDEQTVVVAELSCHQLENIHRGPHVGIILNFYQEHLDHYHSYRDYQMAKMQMMLRQEAGDHCFFCTDSADLVERVTEYKARIIATLHPYSIQEARQSDIAQMPTALHGDHNLSNSFAVQQAAALYGVSLTQFAQALASFHGLPHRLERVGTYRDITFYNDSISTIPEATIAALQALPQTNTLILGGFDRGIDYSPLANFLTSQNGIDNIVFVGKAGLRMKEEWEQLSPSPLEGKNLLVENNYTTIVAWCYRHTYPNTICLLSPAAASYDSFDNFEHRGNTYKELIMQQQ
ncbi:MAG: UDP-N-acetylmuramoyl-L-alanine--D-glutamate ligase [Bacteroidales bacterium]|nr:UDP-N-acetylmuramoyl-L-alanine--D-glutamate ligase [Bacteroidales bacterium]